MIGWVRNIRLRGGRSDLSILGRIQFVIWATMDGWRSLGRKRKIGAGEERLCPV